mmetsp:Transcript_5920/g.14418  ORF Transcript_5920/g.14418 Transcript_5920/m.14418 type:complete len:95 (+) Transcript_5920:994-1278(+)
MAATVKDFSYDAQESLYLNVNQVVAHLNEIDELAAATDDSEVPLDVVQAVDWGMNPQLVTMRALEATAATNRQTRAVQSTLKGYLAEIEEKLKE